MKDREEMLMKVFRSLSERYARSFETIKVLSGLPEIQATIALKILQNRGLCERTDIGGTAKWLSKQKDMFAAPQR